jgi:uncharacterized protein YhhL (DUF1145 family)
MNTFRSITNYPIVCVWLCHSMQSQLMSVAPFVLVRTLTLQVLLFHSKQNKKEKVPNQRKYKRYFTGIQELNNMS